MKKALSVIGYFLLLYVASAAFSWVWIWISSSDPTWPFAVFIIVVLFMPFIVAACATSYFFVWLLNKKNLINLKEKTLFFIMCGMAIFSASNSDMFWNFPIKKTWVGTEFISGFLNAIILYFIVIQSYLWVKKGIKKFRVRT